MTDHGLQNGGTNSIVNGVTHASQDKLNGTILTSASERCSECRYKRYVQSNRFKINFSSYENFNVLQ